jgi:tetratricopeptide (TPR) repeat protein
MRYVCVHCEHQWESQDEKAPQRCPSCMRANGVQPLAAHKAAEPARPRRSARALLGLFVVMVLAAVAGYFAFGRRPTAGDASSLAPTADADLPAALQAAGVNADATAKLLAQDATIERFARTAVGAASAPYDKANGVVRAIRARASALAFVPWSLGEPRASAVMSASQTLATLSKDNARAQLYPLEVAGLAVAALRSVDVPAMVTELVSVEGERAPLDPSGYLGYFAVAVYAGEAGLGAPRVFDPYGGRALAGGFKHTVLRDPQVIGAALALRALHEASYLADPKRALESSSQALALSATLPSVRTVRGMVVLAGKQVEQGLQEFAAARQLRPDSPRLHNVATAELMTGDFERATKDLHAALERMPDFASAHATLGSLAMMRGEPEEAERELAQAQKLAPDLSLVSWAQAEYWLRAGEREQALALARRALDARPSFDARLRMGVLLRQAGRYDELRSEAQALLAMSPPYRANEVRELIKTVLGPAALDAAAASDDDNAALPPPEAPKLEPGSDMTKKLLDLDEEPARGPSLRDPDESGSDTKLRLRDNTDRLQLQLGR